MNINRELIRFHGKVITLAEKFGGSASSDDAQPFVAKIYDEFLKEGSPKGVEAWLTKRLSAAFKYVDEPPHWVEQEPSWPFFDGDPMVFISQKSLAENEVTSEYLGINQTVYLFGSRKKCGDGFELEYKVVTQIEGF
ncbi:hypothetical protein [Cerasicoccus frondis]|uniref:hypothetical protein n=1 Tax=Cerasicoccus frondis TaxID=490090 RepID=UPI0028529C93|nr:hypothetical protein [Cerasicoccus frondis]